MNKRILVSMVCLGASLAGAGCAAGTSRCTGQFPKPGQPGISTCHDVSMGTEEAETADAWAADIQGRIHSSTEECSFWTQKLEQAPASSPGLTQYAQINRSQACAESGADQAEGAKRETHERDIGKAWIEVANAEMQQGTCDTGYREALELLLSRMKTNLELRRDEGNTLHSVVFVDHRLLVANEEGTSFEFSDWANSAVHVFAIAALPVSLDVHRGADRVTLQSPWSKLIHYRTTLTGSENNAGTTLRIVHPQLGEPPSIFTRDLGHGIHDTIALDSRMIQSRAGDPIKITVRGRGCALLAAFRDLN